MEDRLIKLADKLNSLNDLSTRIDERLNSLVDKQENMEVKIDEAISSYKELIERLSRLEMSDASLKELKSDFRDMEKRLTSAEYIATGFETRWKTFVGYVVQLIWIIIACWILLKLNLTPPAIN